MIFNASEIARATRGVLVRAGPAGPLDTDSRRLREGAWFVVLKGERFDAHAFLPMARAAGCAGAISSAVPEGWDRGFIRVDDGLQALQDLARFARAEFSGPVVGITGSAGKTTTRALVALALASLGPVHQTIGNLNNHVGLPLTLVGAPPDAAAWVVEIGMNHAGEIALLQEISRPTVRLITNVGAAHLEGVGSLEGVARAKGELFDGALPGDTAIKNADDPRVDGLPVPKGVRVLRYGSSPSCDVRLTDAVVHASDLSTRFRLETAHGSVLGRLPSPGLHLAQNAAAAAAVALALHIPLDGLAARLGGYAPVGMRLRVEDGPGGVRVINDAYNANPLSMAASLRTLAVIEAGRKVALLGDMLELGAAEAEAHAEVLDLALGFGFDVVGLAGPRFRAAADAAGPRARDLLVADDAISLGHLLRSRIQPGDLMLLKGSRGLAMERVLQSLQASKES